MLANCFAANPCSKVVNNSRLKRRVTNDSDKISRTMKALFSENTCEAEVFFPLARKIVSVSTFVLS